MGENEDMDNRQVKKPVISRAERLTDARMKILEQKWGTGELNFNHQVLCQLALPYRNPDPINFFERSSGTAYIRVNAGEVPDSYGKFREVGVPYGTKSRLILILLSTLAVRNRSRTIPIDNSFRRFCSEAGVTMSARNAKQMKEQLLRLSACSLKLAVESHSKVVQFQGHVFSEFSIQIPVDERQQFLWDTHVKFSHEFYESLIDNAVPFDRDAVLALKHSCRAMDIYLWLASTLFRRKRRTMIRWTTLQYQFGNRLHDINGFKRAFKEALRQALLVYPKAQVQVIEGGLCLDPSPPPVPTKNMRRIS